MKNKEIKSIRKKLIKSVKKTVSACNKELINTLKKDLKKSVRLFSESKSKKPASKRKHVASVAA